LNLSTQTFLWIYG